MTIAARLAALEQRRPRVEWPSREPPPELRAAEVVCAAELAEHGDQARAVRAAEETFFATARTWTWTPWPGTAETERA